MVETAPGWNGTRPPRLARLHERAFPGRGATAPLALVGCWCSFPQVGRHGFSGRLGPVWPALDLHDAPKRRQLALFCFFFFWLLPAPALSAHQPGVRLKELFLFVSSQIFASISVNAFSQLSISSLLPSPPHPKSPHDDTTAHRPSRPRPKTKPNQTNPTPGPRTVALRNLRRSTLSLSLSARAG